MSLIPTGMPAQCQRNCCHPSQKRPSAVIVRKNRSAAFQRTAAFRKAFQIPEAFALVRRSELTTPAAPRTVIRPTRLLPAVLMAIMGLPTAAYSAEIPDGIPRALAQERAALL